jgi:hypothetical protein
MAGTSKIRNKSKRENCVGGKPVLQATEYGGSGIK